MNIIKKIKNKIIFSIKKIKNKKNISNFSDKKLISTIGTELHVFYYPEKGATRKIDYLKSLIKESKKRNLEYLENVRGAEEFLKNTKKNNIDNQTNIKHGSDYFLDLALKRKSIRKFSKKKVSEDKIYKILKCAIEAPSSCNRQAWRFLIINKEESKSFISKARRVKFLEEAPIIVCVFVDKDVYVNKEELNYTAYMDGSAAIMNMIYAAESLGLSSCWVNFGKLEISNLDEFYNFFKIDYNLKPISLVVFGYGQQKVKKPNREKIDYFLLNKCQ